MSATTMWIALAIFAGLLVFLGYLGHRGSTNTLEDFVLGSRKLSNIPAFFTVTATLFSAFSYFGITGQFYTSGIGAWIQVATTAAVGPILYFAGTRIWVVARKYGIVNVTEYLTDRYRSRWVGLVAGVIMIAALVPYMGAQFRGSGLTLEAVTNGGIPYGAGAVFLAVVVTLYVMSGGFRSVVWTDVIQGALMYVLLAIAAIILVFTHTDGYGNLLDMVEEQGQSALLSNPGADGLFGLPYLISVLVIFAAAHFTMPQLQQRWMAARSHSTLKFMAISLPVGTAIIYFCLFYIAMVGVVTRPGDPAPEAIYPAMIMEVLPQWLLLVAILAIIAATGSTANSIVLTLSSIVAKEYVNPARRRRGKVNPEQENKALTTTARVLLPVLVAGGLLVAFFGPSSIIGIIVSITWPAVFLIFPTLLAGLYWRRATAPAAVTSMVVSELIFLSLNQGWLPISLGGWHPAIPAAIVGVILLVGGSYLTQPPSKEHIERHFELFETDPAKI
ncbi:sodium:solute symporter family protein [Ruania halotolerans]|uniref:sodium:solute symporter family protein n=1 Tax=Ruania halotolerans TaxID=2897773 RepID=UPI001E45DE84|nr:sodium:solute symporter family protein [Ruania halotolerans]UFU06258.1 sodium:solute symporter family protein [Ruania halotolerans]